MASSPMDRNLRKQQLNNMKWTATGLMLAMAVLLVFARLQGKQPGWHWVSAFAEAAVIGALADWFAVVAIFRHPLKLPIPRTAIIPQNKERIAENLAAFVRDNFLSVDTIISKARSMHLAQRMAGWLSSRDTADAIAKKLMHILAGALHFIDDQRVARILRNSLQKQLHEMNLGNLVSALLEVLTQNNQHQALLDHGLRRLSTILDGPVMQQQLATAIIDVSKKEYPKLIKMLGIMINTDEFGLRVSNTLVKSLQEWLHDIGDDPQHWRRKQFDQFVENFIDHVKNDPAYHQRIEEWKLQFLETPVVADYFETLWVQFKNWLEKNALNEESRLHTRLSHSLRHFGRWILDNPELYESINDYLIRIASNFSGDIRDWVSHHIANTVKNWDDRGLVRELELSVGRDLQFIRINGTLVGGIIGITLHAGTLYLPGMF